SGCWRSGRARRCRPAWPAPGRRPAPGARCRRPVARLSSLLPVPHCLQRPEESSSSGALPPTATPLLPQVHELPPEAALDAEVAAGHVVIDRRADLDDPFVLHVHGQGAADAAIGADGVGGGLP